MTEKYLNLRYKKKEDKEWQKDVMWRPKCFYTKYFCQHNICYENGTQAKKYNFIVESVGLLLFFMTSKHSNERSVLAPSQ